jgi:rhodanese-related sulfurtransferase
MIQKMLHIKGRLVVPAAQFEQENDAESARAFADVPGLLWKIAYVSHDGREAGGYYLFKDEASVDAFVEGPIVAALGNYPLWRDTTVRKLDILESFSKAVRAPIGEKFDLPQPARTFGQMAEEALSVVPAIKPVDAQHRQQTEPELLIIDVRDAADIAQTGTVPGAINISYGALTYMADHQVPESWRHPKLADRSRPIITTCILGPLGALSGKLLHDMGFGDVHILEGGVQGWIDAGLPVE